MRTNGLRLAAGMLVGFAVLVLMPAQAAAHCRWYHPHHCMEVVLKPVGTPVDFPIPEIIDESLYLVVDVVVAVGEYVDGDFELCDCSKTMEEQGVNVCVPPTPACPPDSPHEMRTPLEEPLATDICGLIRYARMDGDVTIYRGVGYGSAAWIIASENGKVVTALKMRVFPDMQYRLKSNQGWNCGNNPW